MRLSSNHSDKGTHHARSPNAAPPSRPSRLSRPSPPQPTTHRLSRRARHLRLVLTVPAPAQEPAKFQVELVSSLIFDDDFEESDFALRGAYRPSDRWSFESRITRIGGTSLDIYAVDASARYHFDLRGRSQWYLVGGPGTVVENVDDLFDSRLLFHAGIGTEIELTERLFLRPELLVRTNDEFSSTAGDLSVGIGWRF